jgi:toxin-antitoxin system PIN domain toxin
VILPDVNVLIYAFRADSERHPLCKRWLDQVVLGQAAFGMSPQALCAVARIVTNPRIFIQPSPLEEVFAYADNLLGQPHCEVVTPGTRHWAIFKRLCIEGGVRGPLVADAWFAALAIERGCVWITFDRDDYARFPGLEWRAPVA